MGPKFTGFYSEDAEPIYEGDVVVWNDIEGKECTMKVHFYMDHWHPFKKIDSSKCTVIKDIHPILSQH